MPNYFTVTRNPIARAGVIRKLMAKGYSLFTDTNGSSFTVSDYFTRWPAQQWPVVIIRNDGPFAARPSIDMMPHVEGMPSDAIRVSPVTLAGVPNAKTTPVSKCALPVFPNPAKYSIEYVKADGTVGNYTISNPIEANTDSITAYAFGRGVRTFKKPRVRSFSKIC